VRTVERVRGGVGVAISGGGYAADVTSAGATLRSLAHEGRHLIAPFAQGARRPEMRGAVLAPWPGRTAGARYAFEGSAHELSMNEPAREAALHGFAAWTEFEVLTERPDRVCLSAEILPGRGYPWTLRLDVEVSVSEAGLSHVIRATNVGRGRAPVGLGFHPYLLAGAMAEDAVDTWAIDVPAGHVVEPDPQTLLPGRRVRIARESREPWALRRAHQVRDATLNHSYSGLDRDAEGWAQATVVGADGAGVELSVDPAYRWLHVYTADEAEGAGRRASVAVEPMTCPPDAFNSGEDLTVLERGESIRAECRIRAL